MTQPPSLQSSLSSLELSPSDPVSVDLLLARADTLLPTAPGSALPLYTQALALAPHSAPTLASRSAAYLKLGRWPEAYFDACQGLDESGRVTGLDDGLKVLLIMRCGEACAGAKVWDLAVVVSFAKWSMECGRRHDVIDQVWVIQDMDNTTEEGNKDVKDLTFIRLLTRDILS